MANGTYTAKTYGFDNYLEMQGLSAITGLDVALDEGETTDTFTVTANSYDYDGSTYTNLALTLVFDDGNLSTSLGVDTLAAQASTAVSTINDESLEGWYGFFDPAKDDQYALAAADDLLEKVGIDGYNNLVASSMIDEAGKEKITIRVDDNVDYGAQNLYINEILLTFNEGKIETKQGIPDELTDAFSDATLNVWYEWSGPDQQRQADQQDSGYFEGDDSHTNIESTFYTFEDWEGTIWTVVDIDEGGVLSSTATGSNGDTRVTSNSWDDSTQTNTHTEIYTSESSGINSTTVESSSQGAITKTYTGTADGIGWMPLNELYTNLSVVETLDQYGNTTNITGTGDNSDGDTVEFTYVNYELLVDGDPIATDFGFDDMFSEDQGGSEWEWTDEWSNTIWVVTEGMVNDNWTMSETAWSMDASGNKDALTGDTRTSYSSWNESTQTNTWTMTEVTPDFNFTRVEVYNDDGTSSETITGKFDQIGWYFLGQTYEGINATVTRDVNWNITSISGTVQDPDDASLNLAVTYSNNDISIDGKSVSDIQDDQPHFEEGGQNTWTWTDWDGVTWTVVDEEINGVWTSTETSSNNDVRTHTSSWDDATGSSTMTETYASGNLELNYSREEIWNSDGTSTENITGTTNQLGWMWLDEIYVNVNVTIEHTWEGMTLNGSGVRQSDTNRVDFGLNEHDELVTSTDGGTTWSSIDFSGNDDFNSNENESWESSWEWMDWDNSVWVVTDSQQGETWSSTEIQYTDDTKTTATGAERMHSSTWNERTQTNIWTDSEKSADGSTDFQRIETQRADGSSTETLIGKTDKFDADDINVTIERNSNWEITDISGTADGAPVGFENGNITVNGVALENFQGDGGHANMESSENSYTWVEEDWSGNNEPITWTVTDKQEGDTWTSTEVGSNGEIRTHKNTWSGDTETWSETYTRDDGTSVSRVEVRNSNDNTSTETITGQDSHFGWWDFDTAYTGLEVTIERDSNWNIISVSGTADDGDVTFGFTDGGLTINGDPFQSGGDDRSNHMQEAYVNTWEWQDGNGVTWTVTDKQDGDTWTSTEEGSNGDVRINSNAWDSDVDDYVYTTSFKSGTDDRDYTIRETWNADGSSTEVIKGATDQINWIYLGETYTDVEVTIVRNQNWETLSVDGLGTDEDGLEAGFSWDAPNNQLSFNSVVIEDTNFSGGGQAEESWSSEWEWTDWEGILWSVVESQVGDVWTSTETGDNGAVRVFESRWNPIKQTSIWSESYDEDSSTDADGQHLDYTRVETYNPNGTSSETITGSTDNIAWYPLHGIYTNVSVTIERDDSWDIFKVYGTGTDPDGNAGDFSWFQDQIVFGDADTGDMNIIENPDDFKVDENQYWENTSEWEDWDGTTWVVTEIQDGSTYTRSETNAERGDSRVETNVWDHDAQTNTRTMKETNSDRGIDVQEISIWNSATETETTNITGTTDHIDWMPLNGPTLVDITLTYDNTHNITAAEGDVTIDSNVKELTYKDGQFLFDNEALTVSWEDWDGSVWEMSQTQEGDTWIRTETAVSGDQTGAKRIESHNWDHATQTQTMTEIVTDSTANGNAEISNVTRVQSFTDGGGSTEVITGSTNHIEWMQLGEIYAFNEPGLTITRDGDWNIKSIEGMGTNSNGDVVPIGFSPNDNQLMINNELVADDIGQTFENTWTWDDGDGTTWTVVDKQSGNTWTSTETGSNGDVRVMESSWDDETQTNTWSESYTNAAKTIDFTKTEVYDENAGTSTMTTTGTSDHIGWMYVGEIYTKIDVTETRDANWDTTGLSGTATNADGDEVSIGWNDGITVDGDMLMTHGPGDFSMSADNFQNEWTFFDHEGIEWTVVESQQGDAWISEETNEFGDVRTNTNYWDNETNSSKNVTKFKTAPDENGLSDINYKMTETWNDDGSSVLEISGDTDHIGWDYVGEVYTDIDVVITRNSDWEIQSVTTAGLVEDGTAKNEEGDSVTISFDVQNPNDLLIDGVSIYRMGDDFYKDFDGDMMDQMDMMHQTGSREFSYTNPEGHEIDVVEEAVVTDLITIKTTDLDISLVFELGSDDDGGGANYGGTGGTGGSGGGGDGYGGNEIATVLSSNGIPEDLDGFDIASLETWYTGLLEDANDALDGGGDEDKGDELTDAEIAYMEAAITAYLTDNDISTEGLDVSYQIADTFSTVETNTTTDTVFQRTRTENLGSETEREANYASAEDFENNEPVSWFERVRSYEDSEYGFKEISLETSSEGEDLTITTNYAPDGLVTMVAEGTTVMGPGMLMTNITVTSVMEDGWKYTDMYGTGIIAAPEGSEMAALDGKTAVITSDGTDQWGEPLIKLTVEVAPGQFQEIEMYKGDAGRQAQMHNEGNPLDRYIIEEGDGFQSSKNSIWDEVTFDNKTTEGTTSFTGKYARPNKPDQTINVTEVRSYDEGGMLKTIVQTVDSDRGDQGETYTRTYSLNDRFDVEIVMSGTKVIRGETYTITEMNTEITPNGDVRIEGYGNKLDGTNVDFFKGHHDQSMEIISMNRDGTMHKMTEDEQDSGGGPNQGPINELQQWQYNDHNGQLWTVIDKFDGQTRTSTETNTVTGDTRTMKDTWSDNGNYSFEMTETIGDSVYVETRSGEPTFAAGKYQEVETVVITENGVTIESYTQTLAFNEDYSATRTLEGTLEFMGETYTSANVVVEQDQNWQATSVSGTATQQSSGKEATITMDGTHPWGDPKLLFTVDGAAISDTRTVISGKDTTNANDPVATDDSEEIRENQAIIIDVIDNDDDADGDTLSIKSIGDASYGEVNLANGQLIYTPNFGYSGADEFTYTVTDGKGGTDQGTVSITVTGVNQAPVAVDDSFSFNQGSGTAVLDVLDNDTDAEDDELSLFGVFPSFPPTKTDGSGKVSVFGGIVSYAPVNDDFVGEDTFVYYVTDGAVDENGDIIYDEGQVTINYLALNNAPVAVADTVTLDEDVDSVIMRVLDNDTDSDGDELTIDSFTNPSHGTARIMAESLFYTPDENYSGSDEMTYTVVDPSGASATQTITLTITSVNDAPVTITDVLNVEEGSTEGITIDLLSNDYDREGDDFTLTSVSNTQADGTASKGTAVKNSNGTVTYTPGTDDDDVGADEFTYVVTDENGAQATGTVSVTVSAVNGAPVTIDDTSTIAEDSSSNRISVLTNDTDPDDDTLSLDSVGTASYGTVTTAGNIALYTPDANYAGSDSFSYWATDGEGGSTKGTVNITITGANDAPTAVDDTLGSISGKKPTTLDLLANDTDPDGDTLTISSVGDAEYGNVSISGGTSVRFSATRNSEGNSDSFEYTITDADGETSTATASFTISSNTNPKVINDKVIYLEDADAAEVDVLDNDTDTDGDSVTVLSVNTDPEYGTATVSNGKVFYVPDSNYYGTDSFTYIAKDGNGGRDEATVAITITSVNDAPTLINDTLTVDAGSSANVVSVLDNDSDTEGDDISISDVTEALHGTATLTAGVLTYTPEDDYAGSDNFTYEVTDGTSQSTATVNITVSTGNTLPTVVADTATVLEDAKATEIDVLTNDSDTDGDELSVASVTQGEDGSVTLSSGSVLYTPDANFAGTDMFTYTVTDGNGGISSGIVTMTVTGVDDDPTATNDTLDPVPVGSGKIEVDLLSNDLDVDGDTIEITAVGAASSGTTTFTGGKIYYQPGDSVTSDIFSYTLTDENDNEATAYASVEVIAANNAPTGAVTITGGTQPYQALTVSNTMADSDGITGDFSYQWYADGTAIIGETASTYTVTLEDVGNTYSVKASYTDDAGNAESKTSDATDAIVALDQPFSFVADDIAEDGTLTLTLKADVLAIYSRSDITALTGADLSLDIDWDKFAALEEGGAKYSIETIADKIILLESSSTSATDSFDTITLASLRLTPPLLTLVDTDTDDTAVDTTTDLISVTIKPNDPTEKVAISLSGTIEANQGQVSFTQYDATMSNITGVAANSDPEGSVTISGTVAVDEVLTASHTITDADGMRAVSYQWLRDGVAIDDATDATYTITTTDINAAISVQASYTDGGSTAETVVSSSSTVTQATTNKPFMFEAELITASEASIALYGADYAENADETIVKLTLNGDITRFDDDNALLYTSVAGAELDVSLDWTQFEAIELYDDTSETFEINKDYEGSLFLGSVTNENGEFSKIVFSSLNTSKKPVLTLVDSVESTARGETDRPTEIDLATIYLNPIDGVDDVEITFGGLVSANQGDDSFTQLSHSLEVVTKTYDAVISTAATNTTITKLTGTSINLWKDGADTTTSVVVDEGEISIDSTVAFDAVKLAATDAYDFDINISDAIDVLRHIVDLEVLTAGSSGFHAADIDNDGKINISDAIDILRHVVELDTIDTFDVIDSNGARVTQLDANATGEAPTWTLIANGDVDMSGSYDDNYVVTADIV